MGLLQDSGTSSASRNRQAGQETQDHEHGTSQPQRTIGELRTTLARLAQAASQIAALYERYGPEEPWGFADPSGWKCSHRYCGRWARCPGGGGL